MEDVATRVICANQAPDHTTIARFRQRHEAALVVLFGEVLALCAEAGLVNVGLIAIDGTKVHANASQRRGYVRATPGRLEATGWDDRAPTGARTARPPPRRRLDRRGCGRRRVVAGGRGAQISFTP